jgi:nitrogen-specific signal transduction histidine kinase
VIGLASTHVQVPFANLALPGAVLAYSLAVGRLIWVSLAENAAARRARHTEADGVVHGLAEELSQPLCAITANADAISRLLDREQADLAEVRAALADIVGDVDRISETLRQAQRLPDPPGGQ